MSRAQNKSELLEFGKYEFDRLCALIEQLTPHQRDKEYIFDNRTAKDIVAHVYAWQLLEINWYEQGMAGKKPAIPAPGYTFKDAPQLNEKLYQEYKSISWIELKKQLTDTHSRLMKTISHHSDNDLVTKKKYDWTGSTNMATYFAAALSSHYVWAIDLIRKHFKISLKKERP
ncbi:ClbS/DfsB family four-helix bundle protein [candidate division WWE3 bacterium]|nr:ClbS/DfsB family four-helix bundle protein [candidate division WWE3 bacterium]